MGDEEKTGGMVLDWPVVDVEDDVMRGDMLPEEAKRGEEVS